MKLNKNQLLEENIKLREENARLKEENIMLEVNTKYLKVVNKNYHLFEQILDIHTYRHKEELFKLIKSNDLVIITFLFDYKTYKSEIVIIGNDTKTSYKIPTPSIPLAGACLSELVAYKCASGQIYVKAMLDIVKNNLEYLRNNLRINLKIEIQDDCVYAPYMVWCNYDNDKEVFHPLLENNYKEIAAEMHKKRNIINIAKKL